MENDKILLNVSNTFPKLLLVYYYASLFIEGRVVRVEINF